jgi:hypothetical protein
MMGIIGKSMLLPNPPEDTRRMLRYSNLVLYFRVIPKRICPILLGILRCVSTHRTGGV